MGYMPLFEQISICASLQLTVKLILTKSLLIKFNFSKLSILDIYAGSTNMDRIRFDVKFSDGQVHPVCA